jgi:O-antigen biosynthesis protein
MAKVDIIVLSYGLPRFTRNCFYTVRENTSDYRLIWLDNGSSDKMRMEVAKEFDLHKDKEAIWVDENLGFVKGVNRALDFSLSGDAEYIVLLNNDTEVTSGWLDDMLSGLRNDSKLGAIGPLTFNSKVNHINRFVMPMGFGRLTDPNMPREEVRAYMKRAYGDKIFKVEMIAFFCTVFRRQVFEQLGKLDENLELGLGDDDDFCYQMRKAGWDIGIMAGVYVWHNLRTTFKTMMSTDEMYELGKRNLAKVRAKHGIK